MHPQYKGEAFNHPYKYAIYENIFPLDELAYVEQFVSSKISWKLHIEEFYEQYEYKFKRGNEDELIFFEYGDGIKKTLEETYQVNLSNDYEIVAHKLVDGQHIAIHNDSPILGRETHRFVVNLNKDYVDLQGGHFYICSDRNSKSVEKIIRPILNSGFSFEATLNSFHAVGKVLKGERLSLVYSFWHESNTPQIKKKVHDLVDLSVKTHSSAMLQSDKAFLERVGLGQIKLRHNTLIDHLVETFSLLKYWGEDQTIAELGLYHSVLGTIYFKKTAGQLVEELEKHLVMRPQLLNLIKGYSEFDIDAIDLNIVEPVITYLKVYFANMVTGKPNGRFSAGLLERDKKNLNNYAKYLSKLAVCDMSGILYCKTNQ